MNGEQYKAILSALADKLNEKDREIQLQKWQIEDLKKKLATAETHLNPSVAKEPKLEIR